MSSVKPIPAGYHSLNPHIVLKNAELGIEFYKKAFNGQELFRMPGPDGKIMHAEIKIGDSVLMLATECQEKGSKSAETIGASSCTLMLYVDNVDTVWDQAVKAGAKVTMPLSNMFWGDRYGQLTDPFGHNWALAQHIEDVSPDDMKVRQQEAMKQFAGSKA